MAAPMKQLARGILHTVLKNAAHPLCSQRLNIAFVHYATSAAASTGPIRRNPLCSSCTWNRIAQQKRTFFGLFKNRRPNSQPKAATAADLPYKVVVPGTVSPPRSVPDCVMKPEYASSGTASPIHHSPILLSEEEMEKMREAGKMARKILDIGASYVKPGVTTDFIDEMMHAACLEHDVYPSTLNYKGFPKSVCTSVNNVMVHGIPDDRRLEEGDIITIDFTVFMNGYHGDVSETYAVGSVDESGKHLIDATRRCRDEAIRICGSNVPIAKIGFMIQSLAQAAGLYVCPSFIGHGIGKQFHCKPDIWHYANRYQEKMMTGMAFTIEPVVMETKDSFVVADDGWTILAERHTRSAQFEHTVLITERGVEVPTASPEEHFEMRSVDEGDASTASSSSSSSSSSEANPEPPGTPKNFQQDDWKFD